MSKTVFQNVWDETQQNPPTRQKLFRRIEQIIKRPVITQFTSFIYPVSIGDDDTQMILAAAQKLDMSNGVALVINTPGGDGLAAERIVNTLRSLSKTKEYWTIVVGKAKSAGTMICLGASKIMMADSSELGPVDPQIIRREDGNRKQFSVYNYIKSYETLFDKAVKSKGNMQPYLQQLARYDEREIQEFRTAQQLSTDITVRALSTGGMMAGKSNAEVSKKIEVFLDPAAGTQVHGRPIYYDQAERCGLSMEKIDMKSELWALLYELYIRTDQLVSSRCAKCIETKEHSFSMSVPRNPS